MKTTSDYVKDECIVLLDRILTGKTLTFFGEDGNGQHGQSVFPVVARIRCFNFEFEAFSDDLDETVAYVRIFLDGYDATVTGHAITDANLRIDLDRLLSEWNADSSTLDWAPVDLQGPDFITLAVDVKRLLSW